MSDWMKQDNGREAESDDTSRPEFQDYIAAERDRLAAKRDAIFAEQEALQKQLDAINREFVAIDAYHAAKHGKQPNKPADNAPRRAPRGSRRLQLMDLIREGNGLSRSEILERMGLKGDKTGESAVSNALTAMLKQGKITREGGKYLPRADLREAA